MEQVRGFSYIEDRFEGCVKIGSGLQAEIFKAIDKETGHVVAVKSFRDGTAFTYEIEALRLLYPHSPPHVVPLKLASCERVAAFPYYKNGELYQYIESTGSMEEVLARSLFHQLLVAIEGIHRIGVVHRDIKPENILLDDEFNIVLADFGLSEVICPEIPIGHVTSSRYCGSESYMAPQMFLQPIKYDGRQADVWSAGCVLFAMVTGHTPFVKAVKGDWWFNQIIGGRRAKFWDYHRRNSPREISEELVDFLDRIFHENEAERATIESLLCHPWILGEKLYEEALYAVMASIPITLSNGDAVS